jgi:hypothetical protein
LSNAAASSQVDVHHRDAQRRLLDHLGLVGEDLDLDRAITEFRVLMNHDPRERVILHDELAAKIAKPNSLLTHVPTLS